MSAMIGSGEAFLISIIARAASLVGTATRTMRQFASLRRAISLSVALTSRVSALVIDCTTISAAPPMTTSPTRTGIDLRRAFMSSSQQIVICHQSDQPKQESQTDIVDDLLTSRIDRPAADQFQHQEGGASTIQCGERQDVRQPQAEAQKRDDFDEWQRARFGGPGRGLHDTDRSFQAPRTQQAPQFLVGGQLVDAPHDPNNRIAGVPDRPSRRFSRTRLPGVDGGMKTKDVGLGRRVELRGCRQRHQLAITVHHDRDRGVLGGIEGASQVLELADRATINGADHVTRLQSGGARRCARVHGADRDWGSDLGRPDRGVDREEDQDGEREVEGGPGNDDDEPLPERMRVEAARTGIHAAVHAGQLDEATERDGPDGVEGLASLPAEELWAESHTELLHLDPGELGADEVAGLVHDHQDAEDDDDQGDENHGAHAGSWLHTRLGPLAAARTWARAQRSAAMTASTVNSGAGSAAASARATEGTMSTNRRSPWRKRATASSLAAFNTAGAVPPRSPASRASATAG